MRNTQTTHETTNEREKAVRTYTTIGDVTGSCGHDHRTPAAAARCQLRHSAACRVQGGYSDRHLRAVDGGEVVRATDAELDEYETVAEDDACPN
jgi:hypothetical protein